MRKAFLDKVYIKICNFNMQKIQNFEENWLLNIPTMNIRRIFRVNTAHLLLFHLSHEVFRSELNLCNFLRQRLFQSLSQWDLWRNFWLFFFRLIGVLWYWSCMISYRHLLDEILLQWQFLWRCFNSTANSLALAFFLMIHYFFWNIDLW